MADFDEALTLIPGSKRLSLHASYAIFDGAGAADRDEIEPIHFRPWVDYARERGLGLDFNPTFFSHPMAEDGFTLSSQNEDVRARPFGCGTASPAAGLPHILQRSLERTACAISGFPTG